MAPTLFISDLHLDPARPQALEWLLRLLREHAPEGAELYILGDLLEYWVGDDDPAPWLEPLLRELRRVSERGVSVKLMHGNRDFLMGAAFARRSGAELIEDPTLIELYGEPTLLLHGDTLCTDDLAYQAYRQEVRSPAWQQAVLAKSLEERVEMALALRARSQQVNAEKGEELMDVNPEAVAQAMRSHGVRRMIHGHTHRPATHRFELDGAPAERIVLSDWYRCGEVLRCDDAGVSRIEIC